MLDIVSKCTVIPQSQCPLSWLSRCASGALATASANARDVRDPGSIPGLGRSPGVGNGNPLQYSCLENAKDRVYSGGL